MDEQQTTTQPVEPVQPTTPPPVKNKDAEDNKVLAVISYLGILCLIPLLLKKDSPFAQFHGKQGLILFLAWVIFRVVMIIPVLGWFVGLLGVLMCLILAITGMVNAFRGEMKELPWIGHYAAKLNL